MTALQPCMGGLCSRREGCPHYTSTSRATPAERLCVPGRDGVLRPAPKFVPDDRLQTEQWSRDFVSMGAR